MKIFAADQTLMQLQADRLKSTLVHKAQVKKRYARDLLAEPSTSTDDFVSRSTAAADREERTDASTSKAEPVRSSFVPRKSGKGKGKSDSETKPTAMHPDRVARLAQKAAPPKKSKAELWAEEQARKEDERQRWTKRTARGAPDRASQMSVLLDRIQRQLGDEKR